MGRWELICVCLSCSFRTAADPGPSSRWASRARTSIGSPGLSGGGGPVPPRPPPPPILYDYYGFPPESYEITWPAPGAPDLASRVRELLDEAGIANASDPARGYDHGTFIPLKLTYPEADVPAIQLSLKAGLDPAEHIALGRAIRPLRDEDVFIIGSGMTFHNLGAFRDPRAAPVAEAFDSWLRR